MENYIGEIRIFAGMYVPQGWHLCDGTVLTINGNEELFAVLGNIYGGDGRVNFALPNLLGKVPVGTGQLEGGSNYLLTQTGGANEVTLTTATMPAHNHTLNATTTDANTGNPIGAFLATSNGSVYPKTNIYMPLPSGTSAPNAALNTKTLTNSGNGQPHENLMPYISINYIIALTGLYPQQA